MKPGNLFRAGANIGSKLKLDDERETTPEKILMYSLELFRRVHFFVIRLKEVSIDVRQLHFFFGVSNGRTSR